MGSCAFARGPVGIVIGNVPILYPDRSILAVISLPIEVVPKTLNGKVDYSVSKLPRIKPG